MTIKGAGGKDETVEVPAYAYHLDLAQVAHAVSLLKPDVDGEQLLSGLQVMHATSSNEAVAYPLPLEAEEGEGPTLGALLAEDPDYLEKRRAALGYL